MSDKPRGERIKIAVREGYTERLRDGSCCGASAGSRDKRCGCGELPALGYSDAEVAGLPSAAVGYAFGCGNPGAFADVREGDVVLDIGSGAGLDCLIAGRRVGASGRVIGLDMTPAMIEAARENARQAGLANVEFRLGDAEAMPVEDAGVDWVISNCVINLAPDKGKVFREVARVLKPGGRVAISDIVLADDTPELPAGLGRDPELYVACVAGAIRESEYLAAVRAAGLVDVAVTARVPYDAAALDAFLGGAKRRLAGGEDVVEKVRRTLTGRVLSARIVARKPGAATGRVHTPAPTIEEARATDASSVIAVLAAVGLPTVGVAAAIDRFVVARDGGSVIGCAGLELYGETALLRSLAVLPAYRGRGVGGGLARRIVERARASGAREAVLLTSTVQAMAAAFGFTPIARETLPAEVRDSWEFAAEQCGAAACMRMTL
jgi:N-acetylglutamate synthase-like GNAT family acetyltransferase/2-polyprenyl-3-methyl-5-hydroxy-6-metoxy-1,4-benzoquinol methylase